jgi:beta-lactamase class A
VDNQNDIFLNFIPLRQSLSSYVNGQNNPISVYFEYLPSGVSIGIHEKEEYVLASLLKVPVAMAGFESIQEGKIKEDDLLTVTEAQMDDHFGSLWKKGPGYKLTVAEAIRIMLVESDNTAARLVFDNLPEGAVERIFDRLDIPKILDKDEPVVTAKNYSTILKSLYFSSILSKENSNQILRILTQTNFSDRLASGVPAGIPVAHKIGVHTYAQTPQSIFTDCGIIYQPKRPYIACVMLRGTEEEAKTKIADISKMIYSYVSTYK